MLWGSTEGLIDMGVAEDIFKKMRISLKEIYDLLKKDKNKEAKELLIQLIEICEKGAERYQPYQSKEPTADPSKIVPKLDRKKLNLNTFLEE